MRVLVNLMWLRPGRVGGTETYVSRLLGGLADGPVEVHLAVQPSLPAAHPDLARSLAVHVAPRSVAWGRPARVAVEARWLPSLARTIGADLVHHAGGTVPPTTTRPNVVTIHDLQYLVLPENFHPAKRAYLRRAVPASARRATVVVTPSEHARTMVVSRLGVPDGDTAVVPHGVDPPGRGAGADAGGPQEDPGADVGGPYVLFPAVTWPHKNHDVLLQALAAPELADVRLVLTGAPGPAEAAVGRAAARLGVSSRVVRTGRVSAQRLDAYYRGAVALVFPSRFEGFGAPVVEAWWRNCPVVAADAAALPEVVGDAGLLVAPGDVAGWVAAIASLGEPQRRVDLIEAGRRRAPRFSVAAAASAQLRAWQLALDR